MTKIIQGGLIAFLSALSFGANANLIPADVVSSYRGCKMTDNGDGTSTAEVIVSWKPYSEEPSSPGFISRGMLYYTYSKDGVPTSVTPLGLSFNAAPAFKLTKLDPNYVMAYSDRKEDLLTWLTQAAITGTMRVRFNNNDIMGWPAISLRAGNKTIADDVADHNTVYIARGSNGTCHQIPDPNNPPPPDIEITINAPDWNLGEIKAGENEIALNDQFCLTYVDSDIATKSFVIDAQSQNSSDPLQYHLINLDDNTSDAIPYKLVMQENSSDKKITLPNGTNSGIALSEGGKTCFRPTFYVSAPSTIEVGNYADTLNFTVVTKA